MPLSIDRERESEVSTFSDNHRRSLDTMGHEGFDMVSFLSSAQAAAGAAPGAVGAEVPSPSQDCPPPAILPLTHPDAIAADAQGSSEASGSDIMKILQVGSGPGETPIAPP